MISPDEMMTVEIITNVQRTNTLCIFVHIILICIFLWELKSIPFYIVSLFCASILLVFVYKIVIWHTRRKGHWWKMNQDRLMQEFLASIDLRNKKTGHSQN